MCSSLCQNVLLRPLHTRNDKKITGSQVLADDGGWSNTSHRKRFRSLYVAAVVCGRALSWRRTIPEDNIPRLFWKELAGDYCFRHVYGLTALFLDNSQTELLECIVSRIFNLHPWILIQFVAMVWLAESLPSNPRAGFIPGRVRNFSFYPGIRCVSLVCVLSCVISGDWPHIMLTTHSGWPALVYLSSVLAHSLLLSLQAPDLQTFGL